jgi:hypothetical protein
MGWCNLLFVEEEIMRRAVSMIILALLVLGFGFAKSVSADGWKWVPAEPPVTLPDLISKGGQVEAMLGGPVSFYIPNMEAQNDFVVAAIIILHDQKLYRCIAQDGESMGDGNCFVAANK